MSSAVRGWPSDHLRFGRSLYVHRFPSAEPFQDSARPGMVAKSLALLSVSVAYCMFHASKAATVTPRTGFMLSMPWVMPMVSTTFPESWPDAVGPVAANTINTAASAAATSPPMNFTRPSSRCAETGSFRMDDAPPSADVDNFVQRGSGGRRSPPALT